MLRNVLRQVKLLGLIGFLGGLIASGSIGLLIHPRPQTIDQWQVLHHALRCVFWVCIFSGLVLVLLSGIGLWLIQRRTVNRQRWFRLKMLLLLVCIPTSHLWARGRTISLYEAMDAGDLASLPHRLDEMTTAYLVSAAVFFGIAMLGRVKPRLEWSNGAMEQ
jgi:hypothetical protein